MVVEFHPKTFLTTINCAVLHQTNKDVGVLQFQFLLLLKMKLIILTAPPFVFKNTVPDQYSSL